MLRNPFASPAYGSKWLQYFEPNKNPRAFTGITGVQFIKGFWPHTWVNVGKNLTKGIDYKIGNEELFKIKKKVLLIYDVPTYFNPQTETSKFSDKLGFIKVKQHQGYLLDLKGISSMETFLSKLSRNKRQQLKRFGRKLEGCFDIRYEMYHGSIEKTEHTRIFKKFKELLEKRFSEKRESNGDLDPKRWSFYEDVTYPMINTKQACILVVFDKDRPIGILLSYFRGQNLIMGITAFDTDYAKFNLGSLVLLKQIEWCIENGIEILDFSKGEFDYKKTWGTIPYSFESHILYDKTRLITICTAHLLKTLFTTRHYLIEKGLNKLWRKTLYNMNHRDKHEEKRQKIELLDYSVEKHKDIDWEILDCNGHGFSVLKKAIFSFVYTTREKYEEIQVYRNLKDHTFMIKGKSAWKIVQLN